MHQNRHPPQHRGRISLATYFLLTMMVSVFLYVAYYKMYDVYDNRVDLGRQCCKDLINAKYQLESVSRYRKSMDTLINSMQKENDILQQSVVDYSNHYLLMKYHLDICELQTEAIEAECKKTKSKLLETLTELTTCKKPPG